MSSPIVNCPECDARLRPRPNAGGKATCPDCGARFRIQDAQTALEPEEAARGQAEEAPDKEPKRKKKKTPVWVLAIVILPLLLVAGGMLIGGLASGNRPESNETAGGGQAGAPAGGANGVRRPPPSPFAKDAEPARMTHPPADFPPELADTIFLLPDDTQTPEHAGPDLFERELARQALWLAGREEFGLRVRDSALGDVAPEKLPGERQYRIRYVPLTPQPWSVVAGTPGAEHKFWAGSIAGFQYPVYPARCVAEYEELTRGFFARCLAGSGLTARPNKASDAPAPAAAESALGELRETMQFAAVRLLHEEIRAKGESDALISALVRGYANLGLLTEFHWSSAPLVFKARAMLYAQRLVARSPQSALALRLRAYAAAMTGLHGLALEDLAAAAKLPDAGSKGSNPPWVEMIDAYVHFDLDRLAAVRSKADTPLVRLLQFLTVEAPETQATTIGAGRELLAADPECYRVHDSMCRVGGVAHLHGATLAGLAVFTRHLRERLEEVPGVPASVRKKLVEEQVEPGVYAALREVGGAADRGEPSWSALGGLLQEIRFTQVWHRLAFMAENWGVDATEAAAEFEKLLEGHRMRPLIASFTVDYRLEPEVVRKRLLAAPVGEVDMKAAWYYYRLARVDRAAALKWYQRANHGHGFLYPELVRQLRNLPKQSTGELRSVTKLLQKASPDAPSTQACVAAYGGPEVVAKLGEMEAKYARHAVVQWGIGLRHRAENRTKDAIRCWGRWVELSPSGDAYESLAAVYLEAGDERRWLETLEASLQVEDTGLHHARVRVDIANHYMSKKDFKRAEPYALAAAESWAEWALLCAAECEAGLEHWDEANRFYEGATERYERPAFVWYTACRASGKMDRTAAERAFRGYLTRYGTGKTAAELFQAARFYLLAGEPGKARPLFDRFNQLDAADMSLLFSALLADAEGDGELRSVALDQFVKLPPAKNHVRPIGDALREWSAAGATPDKDAVEKALAKLDPAFRADGEFCFGWYLHNRKEKERAAELWKRCAEGKSGTRWVKTHARACLDSLRPKRD